jgi:VWFA-related protein
MKLKKTYFHRLALFAAVTAMVAATSVQGQKPSADQDVIRVNTELVQTGVTVFDKKGNFVDGLKPEQFELRVDGKPVAFSFFDRITAGTSREQKQLAAIEKPGKTAPAAVSPVPAPGPVTYRGRTIIFFIDDLHLSQDSLNRTRSAMTRFLDEEMTPLDQVAFTSASNQIGFLQQLTDNKAVLRAALARVRSVPYVVTDRDQPPMTEYIAIKVVNGDLDVLDWYADMLLRKSFRPAKGLNRNAVYETIKNRARAIITGFESVTTASLSSLENLIRTTGQLPGRKLVFVVSDGFYLEGKNSIGAANDRLRRVTDAATRTGSVIYTIDARGLFAPIADAAGDRPFDPTGRLDRANVGEGVMSQEGLNALAGDTGGRFLKNQNYFDRWVQQMLEETSNYYLLAWRPEVDEQKSSNFKKIEVSIVGRPDLNVRLPRGFYLGEAKTPVKESETSKTIAAAAASIPSAKGPEAALISALGAPSARVGLPTTLAVSFLDVPGTGPVISASTQMATDVLGYGDDGKQPAAIDLAGVILNDLGKPAGSFKTRLNVNPSAQADAAAHPSVIYSHKIPLKPGIYQVRVAARDDKSGRVGSAAQWIEIPDLLGKQLTLSSLLVGGQSIGSTQKQEAGSEQVQFSVDRRFARGAHMNFLTIIYNAARGSGGNPELDAQIKISRGPQTMVTSPLRRVTVDGATDVARIPYGADIALQTLPPGRYLLQVTVWDRVAKTTATQQISFEIE